MKEKLTSMHRIARWIVGWAVTLRLVVINTTGSIHSTASILAKFSSVADASLMRIAVTSRIAGALESVQGLPAFRVHAARSSQTFVSS